MAHSSDRTESGEQKNLMQLWEEHFANARPETSHDLTGDGYITDSSPSKNTYDTRYDISQSYYSDLIKKSGSVDYADSVDSFGKIERIDTTQPLPDTQNASPRQDGAIGTDEIDANNAEFQDKTLGAETNNGGTDTATSDKTVTVGPSGGGGG
tara:strand:+ start:721 stop:1179 length:459 start_codon:yes stop_codon:yes gene_type:complete